MKENFLSYLSSLSRPTKQLIVIIVDILLCIIATYIAYSLRLEKFYYPTERDIKIFLLAIIIFLPIFFIMVSIEKFSDTQI